MRILGVDFSNGLVNGDGDNWKAKLDKLKQVLGLWSQRDLSFIGGGMILNVLGASRFWHVAKVVFPQSGVVTSTSELFGPSFGNRKLRPLAGSAAGLLFPKGALM